MYTANGHTLTIPRGDTAEIAVTLIDDVTLQPYMLGENEKLQFDLYTPRNVEPIVSRSATAAAQEQDGTVTILLTSADTTQLSGTYKYIIRLINTESKTADTIIGLENDAYCNIK